jgi:hypothetical protein
VRAGAALGRLPRGTAARRAVRRPLLRAAQRRRPGPVARWAPGAGRLRRRLDQARPDRDPRHQQARRRGDRAPPGRGRARGALPRPRSPSARAFDALLAERVPRAGHGRRLAVDQPPTSSSEGAPASARGSSWPAATSCSRPPQDASRSAAVPARSRVTPTAARWPVASACATAGATATRSPAA